MPESDASIIERSCINPEAFAPIFERHYDAIARYCCRRAGQSAGEEVAADTFVAAFAMRDRYDLRRQKAAPWLYGIATNLLRHHFRSEQARLTAYARGASLDQIPETIGVEDRLDAEAQLEPLTLALRGLERRDRDVLLLYAWEELTYAEIAEALGIPVGTVRSRLNRVRRVLREQMELKGESKE